MIWQLSDKFWSRYVVCKKKKGYLTISGQKISLSTNPEILISDMTVVVFRLCGAWYRYLYLRKNHPTIKLRWWLWRNNGDFFVFVSRFRKMWLTMQNRILRHSLQENWTWKSKGFSKSYQNHKTVQNLSVSYPRKIFIFFKSRHVWLWWSIPFVVVLLQKFCGWKSKDFSRA